MRRTPGQDKIRSFIADNTRLIKPPLVPELVLHLAEESLPIWRKTEEELNEINVPPPYWAFAWAGGQALARYILDNPASVAGRTILDIGTGSGLVAIAAKLAGAARAVANDIDLFAVEACALNAKANSVLIEFSARDILSDLTNPNTLPRPSPLEETDVVALGDVFYERTLAERNLEIAALFRDNGCRIFVGDPRRSYFPHERFTKLAEYSVPVTRELEDSEIKRTAVWEYTG